MSATRDPHLLLDTPARGSPAGAVRVDADRAHPWACLQRAADERGAVLPARRRRRLGSRGGPAPADASPSGRSRRGDRSGARDTHAGHRLRRCDRRRPRSARRRRALAGPVPPTAADARRVRGVRGALGGGSARDRGNRADAGRLCDARRGGRVLPLGRLHVRGMADRGRGHRDGGRPAPRARRARMGPPARAGERRGRQGARGDSARLPRRDGGRGRCVRLTFRRAHHRAPTALDRAPSVRRLRRLARARDAAPTASDVPASRRGRRLGAPPTGRADHDPRVRGRRAVHRPTRAPAAQRVGGDLRDDLRRRRGGVPARRRARASAGGARHRRGRRPRAGHGHPGGVA